jgi:hypothetical protein
MCTYAAQFAQSLRQKKKFSIIPAADHLTAGFAIID